MPRLQKPVRRGRIAPAPAAEASQQPVPDDAAPGAFTEGRVTTADRDAALPPEQSGAGESAGAPGIEDTGSAGELDQGSALGDGGEESQPLSAEELVDLVAAGKQILVAWYVQQHPELDARLVATAGELPASTRATLRTFAPQVARYLPALNANAPLVGALCFAGILAADLFGTWSKLKAATPAVVDVPNARAAAAAKEAAGPVAVVIGREQMQAQP